MKNNYKSYTVRFWDYDNTHSSSYINYCFGNTRTHQVKARTPEEAIRKTKSKVLNRSYSPFKIHSILENEK